jgi:hypothetical protein
MGQPSASQALFQYPIKEACAAMFPAGRALEESAWNDVNSFGGQWREGWLLASLEP